ncbi:iron-sulfur cluster assembly scaffold protein NifU [Desulfitibacter alkalitolerans]|uniref:iron-sulfur cluster assembly scaffold protein NifU n=1 Tax=Desulfitibacter alkalitolerans TaxID=264641 RepID=UPI0004864367|nr:iron-sulfur cluster assembly scaffold protein NifU [Desulfitibacter alkalitolerans]
MYTELVNDHFQNPRNQGFIEDPDVIGEVSNENLGDSITLYLKIKDNIITDIKYEIFGCPAAIATASMLTELVKGKSLEEALKVTKVDVAEALGGLPERKMECSTVSVQALREAIEEYKATKN